MADNNLELRGLSAEEIEKLASAADLPEGLRFEGGTSYMDDIADISEPDIDSELTENAPAVYLDNELEFIETPQISDNEALPAQKREDRGNYDPLETRRFTKRNNAPGAYDLVHIETPQISDDEALPDQKPEDRGNYDPFARKRPSKKSRDPADYDLEHIEVPEFSDQDELPLNDEPDDDVSYFHKKPAAPQSYDLEVIDVPQFSDTEALPDIGPVFVKPEQIKKPKQRRRFEDDFPPPVIASGLPSQTSQAGSQPRASAARSDDFPPYVPKSPTPKPQASTPPPAPKPQVSTPPPAREERSGGFFKKLFGKK